MAGAWEAHPEHGGGEAASERPGPGMTVSRAADGWGRSGARGEASPVACHPLCTLRSRLPLGFCSSRPARPGWHSHDAGPRGRIHRATLAVRPVWDKGCTPAPRPAPPEASPGTAQSRASAWIYVGWAVFEARLRADRHQGSLASPPRTTRAEPRAHVSGYDTSSLPSGHLASAVPRAPRRGGGACRCGRPPPPPPTRRAHWLSALLPWPAASDSGHVPGGREQTPRGLKGAVSERTLPSARQRTPPARPWGPQPGRLLPSRLLAARPLRSSPPGQREQRRPCPTQGGATCPWAHTRVISSPSWSSARVAWARGSASPWKLPFLRHHGQVQFDPRPPRSPAGPRKRLREPLETRSRASVPRFPHQLTRDARTPARQPPSTLRFTQAPRETER